MNIKTANWTSVQLRNHVDILTGFPFKSAKYTEDKNDIRLIRGDNIAQGYIRWDGVKKWNLQDGEDYSKYELQVDDVILAMDRPWIEAGLKYAWITSQDIPSLLVQRVARLRGINGLETNFLRYIIASPSFTDYIKPIVTGVAVPHISTDQIKSYNFILPPIHIQRRIVEILSAYDDLIENNTRHIHIMKQMAQAIYQKWFGKVDANAESLPKGWELTEVKQIINRLPKGVVYEQQDVSEEGEVVVIDQSRAEFLGFHNNAPDFEASPSNPIAIFGDHTCKMQLLVRPFSIGPNVIPFISKSGYPIHYVFSVISGLVETKEYKRHWSDLNAKKIALPTIELAKEFSLNIEPILAQQDLLARKNTNLRRTRDLLLPRLVSGEIELQ